MAEELRRGGAPLVKKGRVDVSDAAEELQDARGLELSVERGLGGVCGVDKEATGEVTKAVVGGGDSEVALETERRAKKAGCPLIAAVQLGEGGGKGRVPGHERVGDEGRRKDARGGLGERRVSIIAISGDPAKSPLGERKRVSMACRMEKVGGVSGGLGKRGGVRDSKGWRGMLRR